eukprot:m51a1_g381 hypothetical protein (625) ;mRNA; f:663414-670753
MVVTVFLAGSLIIAATSIVPLSVEWSSSIDSFSSVSRRSIDTQSDIMRRMVLDKAKESFGQEILRPVHFIDAAILRIELSGVDVTALPSMLSAALDTELLFTVGLGEMMTQMGFSTFTIATSNSQGHHLFMVNWGTYDLNQRNNSFTVRTYNATSKTPTNETVSSTADWPITSRPFWPLVTNRSMNSMWSVAHDPVTQVPMPLYAKRIPRRLGAHDGVLAVSFELKWLTHYLSFFKITENSFGMLFENTNQMSLIALTEGSVIDPVTKASYTVLNHPAASIRRPVEQWLARTGGARAELSFAEGGMYNDISLVTRHLKCLSEMQFDKQCPHFNSVIKELQTMRATADHMTVARESFSVYVPKTVVNWLIRTNKKPPYGTSQSVSRAIKSWHAGPGAFVCALGTAPADWPSVARLRSACPARVAAAYGVHPWHAHALPPTWRADLAAALAADPSTLVGEIGLDRASKTPETGRCEYESQIQVFREQWAVACEMRRAVSMHCVRAWGEAVGQLTSSPSSLPRALALHSYSGSRDTARDLLRSRSAQLCPVYFGFSQAVNLRRPRGLDALPAVPRDRVLIESDLEDVASALQAARAVAEALAASWGCAVDDVLAQTAANARAFLGLA